jgi:hypothetical protein
MSENTSDLTIPGALQKGKVVLATVSPMHCLSGYTLAC